MPNHPVTCSVRSLLHTSNPPLTPDAAVDGLTGAIYCHQCEDFVYAEIIDTWRNRALRTMEERSDISLDGMSSVSGMVGFGRADVEG